MKKSILVGLALLAVNAMAVEVQIKAGFDPYRGYFTGETYGEKAVARSEAMIDGKNVVKQGFTLGAEIFPLYKSRFELGAGFEYKFGVKNGKYITFKEANGEPEPLFRAVPLYAIGKVNLVTVKDENPLFDGSSPLYLLGRIGYSFNKNYSAASARDNGLYWGLGVGSEYGPLVVEAVYDRIYTNEEKNYIEGVGIKVGARINPDMLEKPEVVVVVPEPAPVVVPEPEPVVVPEPEPEPAPVVVVKKEKIETHCSIDGEWCLVRGFPIEGKEPTLEQATAIDEAVRIMNKYAKAGVVTIIGHTDSTGSVAYNQKLSVARATTVARMLREAGLKEEIVINANSIQGRGELDPMDTNKTKAGRYNNRRVEFKFGGIEK